MTYQVRTEVFEGPFDLLLHLIAKRELDIYEVSLAAITEDYLAHLRQLRDLDLEVATEFLVVAATLIEMKASRLLPGPAREDEVDVSDRDLLIARLLEYRAYKEAAASLSAMLAANAGFFPRETGPGDAFAHLAPDLLARVSPERLAEIAARALEPRPRPQVDVSHIAPIRISVAEAVEEVRAELYRRKRATFRDLTRAVRDRMNLIVRFLAVLELVKRGEARVTQSEAFGRIEVAWVAGGDSAPRVIVVDEYEGAPPDGGAGAPADGSAGAPERTIELDPPAPAKRNDR